MLNKNNLTLKVKIKGQVKRKSPQIEIIMRGKFHQIKRVKSQKIRRYLSSSKFKENNKKKMRMMMIKLCQI